MKGISLDKIVSIEARKHDIGEAMAAHDLAPDEFVRLSKEYAQVEPVAAAAREVRRLRAERDSLTVMTRDADEELRAIASEIARYETRLPIGAFAGAKLFPLDAATKRASSRFRGNGGTKPLVRRRSDAMYRALAESRVRLK